VVRTIAVLVVIQPKLVLSLIARRTHSPPAAAGATDPDAHTALPGATVVGRTPSDTLALTALMTLRLRALVPVPPGVVTAIGPEIAPRGTMAVSRVSETRVNTSAGVPLKLTVKPSAKIRSLLSQGKTVHLTATLTYKSALGGAPTVQVFHVTVKGKRKGHKKH